MERGIWRLKIKKPEPFTFEAGPRAVLLLHGFTGHTADVRMLGRFLEKKGYTSHAPIYRGHGEEPEALIKTTPKDWWNDALTAYNHLKDLGYKEIAIAGLSLGGAFALKLASNNQVKGVIPMCSPMYFDYTEQLTQECRTFAKQYKQFDKKNTKQIDLEINELMENSVPMFEHMRTCFHDVKDVVDLIYSPTIVVQARQDERINPER